MTETTTGKTFESAQDHRSALIQWLADEFYNWTRRLPDDKLAYLHDNFESAMETGLDVGREARFADFYTATYGDTGSTARALTVETDEPMEIRPVSPTQVIIKRA